jgi:hypothetical protein
MKKIKLKIGDVYHFQWNTEEYKKTHDVNWCFERTLVVMKYPRWKEELNKYEYDVKLVDTYWGINRTDTNKSFTLDEIQKRGTLTYYCNLDEIEAINSYLTDEYDDEDLFRLSDQHACSDSCVYHFKKKGAKKSPMKKISILQDSIRDEKEKIVSAIGRIERMSAEIKQLQIEGFRE